MLKITQNQKLSFHERERFFSKNFQKGFLVAVLLHITFFLIFRIIALPDSNNVPLLTPVQIEIDLGPPCIVLPTFSFHSLANEVEPVLLFDIPPPILSNQDEFFSEIGCKEPDFSELEKIHYKPLQIADDFN